MIFAVESVSPAPTITNGKQIIVDLTTKVTTDSYFQVLFTADAPTTDDLTGKNFISTVDDIYTPRSAQYTTEGNGDGDAGDNNSWTVTTTDFAVTSAVAEISPNIVAANSAGETFTYD